LKASQETHEARTLHGSVDIEHAGKESGLVADDADGSAIQPREPDDEILRVVFVHFEEKSIVDNRVNGILDVIRLLGIGGNESVQRFLAASRRI